MIATVLLIWFTADYAVAAPPPDPPDKAGLVPTCHLLSLLMSGAMDPTSLHQQCRAEKLADFRLRV